MKATLLVFGMVWGMVTIPAWAGFEEGAAAFNRKEYATALREFQASAQQGDARGQNGLGALYENGWGVPKDERTAATWYSLAANQGAAIAQHNLASLYENGKGVPQDFQEALRLYRLSAEQGFATPKFRLGYMYETGRGVPKDLGEAITLYRKAAEQGLDQAQKRLGYFYATGQGVKQDPKESVRWFRLAADQGDADAQYRLGMLYDQGYGVLKDAKEARKWYQLAANQGNQDARKMLVASTQTVIETASLKQSSSDSTLDLRSGGRDQVAQRTAEATQKEEATADKSFFGIPLGEPLNFYRTAYSNCSIHKRCVGMANDILNTKTTRADSGAPWDSVNYVVLSKEIVPVWLVSRHREAQPWENEGKVAFIPIPQEWTRLQLHGVSFEVHKEAAIEAFIAKYGKPVLGREIRTSSERVDKGGVGVPLNSRRLSERADIFVWQNPVVVAELACFSDAICDGVIVTQAYWPTFVGQRRNSGGKL